VKTAEDLEITDLFPAEVTIVNFSSSVTLGDFDEETGLWTIASLPVGDTETLTFNATVNLDTPPGIFTNFIVTNSSTPDPDDDDNDSSTDNTVVATSITVIKDRRGGPAEPDDFNLTINDEPVLSEEVNLLAPGEYFLGETQIPGYFFEEITGAGCPEELGENFTLAFGENLVCIIENKRHGNDDRIDPPTLSQPTLTSLGNPDTGLGGTIELDLDEVDEPVTAAVGDVLLFTFAIDENQGWTNLGKLCVYLDNEGEGLDENELSITESKRQHFSTEVCYYRYDNPPVTVTDPTGLLSEVDLTMIKDYKDENDARTFKGIFTATVMREMVLTDFYAYIQDQDENPHSMQVKSVFEVVSPEDFAAFVKDIAQWWSQGYTSDAEFINAIQFLIDEGVITIEGIDPSIPIPASLGELDEPVEIVPRWIEYIAEWWAAGLLEDQSFYDVIEYLVNNGVLVI